MTNSSNKNNKESWDTFVEIKQDTTSYNCSNIFDYLLENKAKILLVGEVQSGKTREIINIIDTSLKNKKYKFDIIILFGGTNIKLNKQTEDRIIKDDKFKNNTHIIFKNFSKQYYEKEGDGKTVVYIGSKINSELERIHSVLHSIPNLIDKKILIIDDESDYGSINTSDYHNPKKYAAIINDLYESVRNNGSGFIGVTATPYANILNKKSITYKKVFSLPNKKSFGYTGISFFNKLSNFYIDIEKQDNILSSLGGIRNDDGKKLYFVLCVYFINILIKKSISENTNLSKEKADLLINYDYSIDMHNDIKSIIEGILEEWSKSMFTFLDYLNNIAKKMNKNIEIKREDIIHILKNISVTPLNSTTDSSGKSNYNILIGGVFLSRGITYEHLVLEYIDNFPKSLISADTLLQMCRWFGYRELLEQYPYINVITTTRCIDAMQEIEVLNNIFFNFEKWSNGMSFMISELQNKLNDIEKGFITIKGCADGKR